MVVTGEGIATNSAKLGAAVAPGEAPQFVSRSADVAGADTIVTTVYSVRGELVTLIDRTSARREARRDSAPIFSDQVIAKARDEKLVNTITWSDSTGLTRTLRGAVSQAELQRVKQALFGPTP